jgi:hypothetical protein
MKSVCVTCGSQFSDSAQPPTHCPICEDERQYVGFDGQKWTTLEELRLQHQNTFLSVEPDLWQIHTVPHFGIGQRAWLLQTGEGNLLWDCLTLVDRPTIDRVVQLGGLKAIAISHPHYYTTMLEWSAAFGDVSIYLHEADREWVMRPGAAIRFWGGETQTLFGGLSLIRCGGHFAGGTVLHWPAGAGGRGAMLSGDIVQVAPDRRWVSFMYSYPNYIPLNATAVERIVEALEPFAFDRVHGAFPKMTVEVDAKAAVRRSAERYLRAIGTESRAVRIAPSR